MRRILFVDDEPSVEAITRHHCPGRSSDRTFSPLTAVHVAGAVEEAKSADLFGEAVNFACKLGEELAGRREILVSARAHGRLDAGVHEDAEAVEFTISGVKLQARRLSH